MRVFPTFQEFIIMESIQIDSHQHFWKFDPVRDAWITDSMKVIQRDFLPSDLEPILQASGIDGCIAVQADQSGAETRFLLNLASGNNFIKGVVGWMDLRSPELEKQLAPFQSDKKLKGFRHIVQAEPDDKFLLNAHFLTGIETIGRHGYTYDILVFPKQLPAVLEFVQRFPNQKFVIDHLAKPDIKNGTLEPWKSFIQKIGQCTNVYCKVSGMVTEANWGNWQYEQFLPYLDTVFEAFGPSRIMYGSDWPVCLLAAPYANQLVIVKKYIATLTATEQQWVMGKTAIEFYSL